MHISNHGKARTISFALFLSHSLTPNLSCRVRIDMEPGHATGTEYPSVFHLQHVPRTSTVIYAQTSMTYAGSGHLKVEVTCAGSVRKVVLGEQ